MYDISKVSNAIELSKDGSLVRAFTYGSYPEYDISDDGDYLVVYGKNQEFQIALTELTVSSVAVTDASDARTKLSTVFNLAGTAITSALGYTPVKSVNGVLPATGGAMTLAASDVGAIASAGVSGGQTLYGGTAAGESLTLQSTSNATKGFINFGTSSAYDQANKRLGIGTAAPTHSLTLPSTADGIAMYNTADQTTNYERTRMYWSGNQFNIGFEKAGSGVNRVISISNGLATITQNNVGSVTGVLNFNSSTATAGGSSVGFTGTLSASSSSQNAWAVVPTINQSGSAGYKAIWISAYEQALGSANNYLIDAGTNSAASGGGTHTSKFRARNDGVLYLASATNASFADGQFWFDGTSFKCRISGATKTFTVS